MKKGGFCSICENMFGSEHTVEQANTFFNSERNPAHPEQKSSHFQQNPVHLLGGILSIY
jgi:hypothetical protein